MLIGIDPLLSGEALAVLRDMGHGDTIAITDSNFPSHFLGPPVIRMDVDATRAGRAILSVMPLDSFVDHAVQRMEIDGKPRELNDGHKDFESMVDEVAGADWAKGSIERFRFYEDARQCVAVFATLERRPYVNYILWKGVLDPNGAVWRPERPASAGKTQGRRRER
jgi:L-fucose mutarotase